MVCCVRGYHEYKDIEAAATREVLVCGRWRAIVGKIFVVKLSCVRVRYFCTFSVYENIFAMKKSELQYSCVHAVHIFECGNAIEVWNGIMFDFYLRLSDLYYYGVPLYPGFFQVLGMRVLPNWPHSQTGLIPRWYSQVLGMRLN